MTAEDGRRHDDGTHFDCSQALYQMMQYVDGELPGSDAADIAAHLTSCQPCLAEHDMDHMVKDMVRRACVEDPAPARLRTTILERITTLSADGTVTEVTRRVSYDE